MKPTLERYISASGHNGNAKGWSENCGFEYLSAKSKEEFLKVKSSFLSMNEKPVILECFTHAGDETLANNILLSENSLQPKQGFLKDTMKRIVGDRGIDMIKKITRK